MKLQSLLLCASLMFQGVVWSASTSVGAPATGTPMAGAPVAEAAVQAPESREDILAKLQRECDSPQISNESRWTSYLSETELRLRSYIAALKAMGPEAKEQVRQEILTARGEYQEMLVVTLAAFGDNDSIWQASRLMLKASQPAVRVCAAMELRQLKDKRLVESFKQALDDPFERMDGACVGPGMIFPVRLIASSGLTGLGFSLEEVRQLEREHLVARLRAGLEDGSDAKDRWKTLVADLKAGRPVVRYNGQQVLLRGTTISQGNPVRVKVGASGIECLLMLQEKDVKLLAPYNRTGCRVEVRGVVRSTNPFKKQVEVWSMGTTVGTAVVAGN